MKDMTAKQNYIMLTIITAVSCLIGMSGCKESVKSAKNRPLAPDYTNIKFEEAPEPKPTARTLYIMANLFASAGNDDKCEKIMKRIISEYPDFQPVYNGLAELQLRQGRKLEAIETMQAGLVIFPQDTTLLNNIGMCRLMCREYEKALEMFIEAAGILPQNLRYRANMAVTLSLMGHYDQSLSLFKQVLSHEDAEYNVHVIRETAMGDPSFLKETGTGDINHPEKRLRILKNDVQTNKT